MKYLLVLAAILGINSASAVPSFDPFADATSTGGTSYAIGSDLVGQNNSSLFGAWYLRGGTNTGSQPVIAAGNLSYPGMPTSSGNSVSLTPSVGKTACLDLNLPASHTETVYYSFLLQVNDLSAVPTTAAENPIAIFLDDPSLAFSANSIARRGARLLTRKVTSTSYVLGTGKSSSTADFIYEPDGSAHNVGDVVFVVASHQRANGVTNLHLWINPPSESFGSDAAPGPTLVAPIASTTTGGLNNSNARAFAIMNQYNNTPGCLIDDVRVATDWKYVTGGDRVITPVSITAQPVSRTVAPGAKAVFGVGASGSEPFTFQWLHNGNAIADATTFAYTLTAAQIENAGEYSVIVSNSVNSVTSSVATLTMSGQVGLSHANVVVLRVGDGAQLLTANGNSISLDQFAPSGTYRNSLALPDTGGSALVTLGVNSVPSPSSVTGTTMSRSADGRFLVIAGYNTAVGYSAALNTASAAAVPRGIGLIDASGQYTLGLASTDPTFNATFWRSAVTDGMNNFWGAARGPGTYYFGFDQSPALVQANFSNIRSMASFNGSIYCVSAVNGNSGVMKLDGMPKDASAPHTILFSGTTGFSDLEVSPSGNVIYVADDRTVATGGGVQKWEFDGFSWNRTYTLTDAVANGVRYVTADFSGTNPKVYAVTKEPTEDNNRLVVFEDTGVASVGTTIAFAGVNQNFRGLRMGPIGGAPVIAISRSDNNVTLTWSGNYTLQSSTDVAGTYSEVPAASSPYSVSVESGPMFFRLEE